MDGVMHPFEKTGWQMSVSKSLGPRAVSIVLLITLLCNQLLPVLEGPCRDPVLFKDDGVWSSGQGGPENEKPQLQTLNPDHPKPKQSTHEPYTLQ